MHDDHASSDLLPTLQVPQDCGSPEQPSESHLSMLGHMIFKGNCIYWHPLLQINYMTYDLHRKTDSVNPWTDYQDIMLLTCRDRSDTQPFCYACILAIYHANVVYIGPESKDYQAQRLDFLWVCWFELLDQPSGWEHYALDKARFVSITQANTYSFVNPADILKCCHIVPSFAEGKLHPDGVTMSDNVHDSNDWKFYYINWLVSFTTGI